jgi:predicted ATP-dependent protease
MGRRLIRWLLKLKLRLEKNILRDANIVISLKNYVSKEKYEKALKTKKQYDKLVKQTTKQVKKYE